MALKTGELITDFSIPEKSVKIFKLKEFKGKHPLIVCFYLKNFTLGCVKEASDFQDKYEDFIALNAEVLGISCNSESFIKDLNLNIN